MSQAILQNIIQQLAEIEKGGLWLNESFHAKIETISSSQAFTRPIPEIHSVAELLWHVLVWRRECVLRLNGQQTDLMNSPDNWKGNADLMQIGWEQLKTDFNDSLSRLVITLKGFSDRDLKNQYLDTSADWQYLVEGIIHHELYHLGQLGITIKLLDRQ